MKFSHRLAPGAVLLLAAGLWEAAVRGLALPEYILPAPSQILTSFFDHFSMLAHHATITLAEILLGVLLATVAGMLLAVLIDRSEILARAIYPLLIGSQMVPVFAVAPVLMVWFGYGLWPKVAVAALIGFFPIAINAADGLRTTSADAVELFRSLDASRGQIFFRLRLPSSLPLLLSGIKVGATLAVVGATIGEWVGAKRGLGYLMVQSNARLQMALVFAAILALALLGLLLFTGLRILERRLLRWRTAEGGNRRGA
ncbi:MAG: ABC transporter permease [Candidatus Bipolaricaulota bacterium]|nr:MAG: ABC transporter permease [Candidatus Bipolaricaulota bacterium]